MYYWTITVSAGVVCFTVAWLAQHGSVATSSYVTWPSNAHLPSAHFGTATRHIVYHSGERPLRENRQVQHRFRQHIAAGNRDARSTQPSALQSAPVVVPPAESVDVAMMPWGIPNQHITFILSILGLGLGLWLLLRRVGMQGKAAVQPVGLGYDALQSMSQQEPLLTTASAMATYAPSKLPATSPNPTNPKPSSLPTPPPPPADGLQARQLHICQVPHSSQTTATFHGLSLPSFVPNHTYAACVVGAGPAGLALAWQLAKQGVSVVVVDNALENEWPNNYGVWAQEWMDMGLPAETLSMTWEKARVWYTSDEGCLIEKPYGRVDRQVTKAFLLKECVNLGVHFSASYVSHIDSEDWTKECVVHLQSSDGAKVKCQMPIVAAGHYSPLLEYQPPSSDLEKLMSSEGEWMTKDWSQLLSRDSLDGAPEKAGSPVSRGSPWGWHYGGGSAPAYQVAYGEEIITEEPHGYPVNEMLFMDWSDDHLGNDRSKPPTFLYAMPTDEYRIFVEDTCLVSRPTLQMEDVQERLRQRLALRGIKVKEVIDVERSVIPLGGPLPMLGRRTVAYGASNNLVHPATGYMVNRAIAEAPVIAKVIGDSLKAGKTIEETTAMAWDTLWPHDKLRTRDFHVFAMEMLAEMNIDLIREFFRTFFKDMKDSSWSDYLAWSMNRGEMMNFALGVFWRASPQMKLLLMTETFRKQGFSVIVSLLGL